ncbi:MAG: mannitol dehydrogenase family protein [Clostridia bacterium]|nr:mannitol dehydrogenase family protein [Clostridia bacterium]
MMLSSEGIRNKEEWTSKGIRLPEFDIAAVREETKKNPEWVHFGAGNIFRGFIGSISQSLLNQGKANTGIIAVESFDFDIIDKIYTPFDSLTLNVLMGSELDMEVLGGISEGIKSTDYERLYDIAENPSLKMISFTITEKGYAVTGVDGNMLGIVKSDIENGIEAPKHTMSIVAAMLYKRYKANGAPVAVVSMDNCSHNGEKLKAGVVTVAKAWTDAGKVEPEFLDYVENTVSFPWSMIDKITPRPNDSIQRKLESLGVEGMSPVITSKGTYIAPFVNAERPQYLVIEDDFPNGRPALEDAGVYLTTRETVNKAETMKVTTCLNPLHTGLAVFGCLLGYTTIWEEMRDKELVNLVNKIAEEGMKVVIDPKIIDPQKFVNEVIGERLPNPYMPDAPQRIATDTSQKIPVRYGETIKSYMRSSELDTSSLEAIPTVIAGWFRYLLAVDDEGNAFEPSTDPMLSQMQTKLAGVKLGQPETAEGVLKDILTNEVLFGTDLYKAGLGEKIEKKFAAMLRGKGAVRKVLEEM